MKYLLLVLLLTTGCSTMSDYQTGCYDGLDVVLHKEDYNSSSYASETDERNQYKEKFKVEVCGALEEQRNSRLERFQRETGAGRRP